MAADATVVRGEGKAATVTPRPVFNLWIVRVDEQPAQTSLGFHFVTAFNARYCYDAWVKQIGKTCHTVDLYGRDAEGREWPLERVSLRSDLRAGLTAKAETIPPVSEAISEQLELF